MNEKAKEETQWQNELDNITTEMLDFSLEAAKEKLNNTNNSSSDLYKKSFFILNSLFITITIILGFFFHHISFISQLMKQHWYFILPPVILLIGFFISLLKILFFFKTGNFHTSGNSPNELLRKSRLKDIKYLKAGYLSSYNKRIKENLAINKRKGKIINSCLKIIYFSLSTSALTFMLILYLALGQAHLLAFLLFGILLVLNLIFLYKL